MSSRAPGRTPLAVRFLLSFAVVYLVLIGVIAWFLSRSVDTAFIDEAFDQLESAAHISAVGMPVETVDLQTWVDTMADAGGYRYTVIDPDGVVLADSHSDPATMDNHADRPEVASAIAGGTGRDARDSDTTGFDQLYVATPTDQELVLRLAASVDDIAAETSPYRRSLILVPIAVGLLGLLVAAWLSRRMSRPIVELTEQTKALSDNGPKPPRSSVLEIDELATAIADLDASNRSRLLETVRASSTLEVVLGAMPQGTILFDEDDSLVYANPSAMSLLGRIPETLSGLVPFSFQDALLEARETGNPTTLLAEHGKPVRQLRGIATPFAYDKRILLVVVDVTERERAAAVRRDFVANASHELKTPVSAIIASSEALQLAVERGDDSSLGFARQIEGSARQLDRLVTDLLDLSRLERDEPELDPLSLDHLVQEELERVRSVADEHGIDVILQVAPAQVAGSRRDVAIAVRNLLDNAIRYTPSGGSIGAELEVVGEDAVLRISDTGEGIPTRDLERVFERFYRVDNARARATGGTGLGLAIVKHVVESHGGSVSVASELGAGSTFTVHLPILERQIPASN
ncbi:MAG TPA: ATP-binding protein [Acidimicrobiia bacterium]|jgi:two-component system, OmpR family, phosphate regulon sensor histidine kinase PhoR|nr:ATP-binding protein [Acidimicrobiia bacterium]